MEFSRPPTASEAKRPFLGLGVPSPTGCRSQVFSTSQRFSRLFVPRPYFMPQPFVNAPFRAFPSTKVVYPSRGHWLPSVIDRASENALPGPYYPWFPRLPRPRRSRRVPPEAMGSIFTDRNPLSDCPGSPAEGSLPACQLHPLRSFAPSVESVRADPGCPDPTVAALLSFSPSSDHTFQASDPRTRPPREGTEHRHSPGGSVGGPRERLPPRPG